MIDRAVGDATGLRIPAHIDALREAGPDFLTEAFRRFGSLAPDNRVTRVADVSPCGGGSTGAKFFLTLEYARPEPGLDRRLFCKFSRDFTDERRDWQRTEMEGEARLVTLSRMEGFPVRVPRGYFADYEAASGTGIVITECIAYGEGDIEPHRRKCMDHRTLADPLPYYRSTVTALARLAGTHKAGRLPADVAGQFVWDPATGSADPIAYDAPALEAELDRCDSFARDCPALLPPVVRSEEFRADLRAGARHVFANESAIRAELVRDPDFIALCHWNAHIDNCWFWRDGHGLHCGLIDWGRVGQITLGSALWGGLSAAHHDIWDNHLDDLLALFVAEYAAAGGPQLSAGQLRRHLLLHIAAMGVARVLAFPEIIRFRLPECSRASGPHDAMFEPVDPARNCLHVYSVFLKLWQREDIGALVRGIA